MAPLVGQTPTGSGPRLPTGSTEIEISAAEALRFLVKLAQPEEFEPLSRGGMFDLIDGLRKYLNVERKGTPIDRELKRAERHPEMLAAVREVARRVAETIADKGKADIDYGAGRYHIDATGPRPFSFDVGTLRDAVLHFASADIDSDQARRIQRCPQCNRIFYGQTNAKYCSRRCAAAAALKNYRTRLKKSGRKASRKE
jgi:hypothetical protein